MEISPDLSKVEMTQSFLKNPRKTSKTQEKHVTTIKQNITTP